MGIRELIKTKDVATRWYRAPEIMLSNRRYTTASEHIQTKNGAPDELMLVHSRRLVDRVYSGRIAGFETHVQGERVSNYTPWFGSILSNS